MKIKVKVENKVDTNKVKKKTKQVEFKSIEKAAGYIRQTVLSSFRSGAPSKAKKTKGQRLPSAPGKPPKRWKNKSGHSIVYGSYPSLQSRYIGWDMQKNTARQSAAVIYASPRESGDKIMQMHEKGGSQYIEVLEKRDKLPGKNYKPMEQRAADEQENVRKYYANIKRKKVKKLAKYPARPFLMPAIKKQLHKIPAIWKTTFNQYFR